jgi:hypothetical protein
MRAACQRRAADSGTPPRSTATPLAAQALSGKGGAQAQINRAKLEAELVEVKRRGERLIDQVADGALTGAAAKEASRAALQARLVEAPEPSVVVLHPAAPQRYRERASRDTVELLKAVVVTPSG